MRENERYRKESIFRVYGLKRNDGPSYVLGFVVFFFFKQKTAYEISECDWSSDVCLPISYAVFCLRSEEHTSVLQSHSEISYADFCLKKKNLNKQQELSRGRIRHQIIKEGEAQ